MKSELRGVERQVATVHHAESSPDNRALRKTGNRGLQPALDYLQDHEGSDGADSDGDDEQALNIKSSGETTAEAKVSGLSWSLELDHSWHGD